MMNVGRYYTNTDIEMFQNKMLLGNMFWCDRGEVGIQIHPFSFSALDGMSGQLYISDASNVMVKPHDIQNTEGWISQRWLRSAFKHNKSALTVDSAVPATRNYEQVKYKSRLHLLQEQCI